VITHFSLFLTNNIMKNTALITGASSGIGKELAHIHAEKGGDLVIVARRKEALEELKKQLEEKYNITVKVIAKDLSKENMAQEIYDELKKENIEIDYLINNAGFGGQGKFHERKWEKDRNMMQVNMVTPTQLCRLFLPDFVKKNSGKILNVSSTASYVPGPLQAVYYATKSYFQFFSNAIAEELHDTDITVTNLMPGATATGFAKQAGLGETELFKNAFPARGVAKDGYNGMIQGKLDVVSGVTFGQKVLIRLLGLLPKKTTLKMVRQMQEKK
jgi:short-subunit dehydrogenase